MVELTDHHAVNLRNYANTITAYLDAGVEGVEHMDVVMPVVERRPWISSQPKDDSKIRTDARFSKITNVAGDEFLVFNLTPQDRKTLRTPIDFTDIERPQAIAVETSGDSRRYKSLGAVVALETGALYPFGIDAKGGQHGLSLTHNNAARSFVEAVLSHAQTKLS